MNISVLGLEVLESVDLRQMLIQDTSLYNPDVTISDSYLEITPPEFSTTYAFLYTPLSTTIVNSNSFGWTSTNDYNKLWVLQDGLWKIRQSINPNGVLFKETYHFRIVNLKKQILDCVSTKLSGCGEDSLLNSDWYRDWFIMLSLLDTAKYMAENCHSVDKAKIIYKKVKKDFDFKCC
jgi:hypothetical protein